MSDVDWFGWLSGENYDSRIHVFNGATFRARGMVLLCGERNLQEFYNTKKIKEKRLDDSQLKQIANEFVNAANFLKTLKSLEEQDDSKHVMQISTISWYYGIFFSARAMLLAYQNTCPQTHSGVAKTWQRVISSKDLAFGPFGYQLSSLVELDYMNELRRKYGYEAYNNKKPLNEAQARNSVLANLKGTAEMLVEKEKDKLKKDYKIQNFRKKINREIRDKHLRKKGCCFLDVAYRWRIKSNYTDPTFLELSNNENDYIQFIKDLSFVCETFFKMAEAYCCSRIQGQKISDFFRYINEYKSLE